MDEWIEWNGGSCPTESRVNLCFRDGEDSEYHNGYRASEWRWNHTLRGDDIIAYQIIGDSE